MVSDKCPRSPEGFGLRLLLFLLVFAPERCVVFFLFVLFPSVTFPQYSHPPHAGRESDWLYQRSGPGGRAAGQGAGRWCFSFFFNIYLINQLPTACCGGLLEQLHRFDLLVQYCNMCAWKPCQRIVTCCVLPFVFLLALLGRLVSVCFLYQCSFNRG